MTYHQITFAERYTLGLLRQRGLCPAAIARMLGRHRSTIAREVRRNQAHADGTYRPQLADWYARGRRSRSRRNRQFTAAQWAQIQALVREDWSPQQVAGWLRRHQRLAISHETIYRHIWAEKRAGGTRPAAAETRRELGHWEADTMLGASQAGPCVLSLVERKTGYLLLGQLGQHSSAAVNQRAQRLIAAQPHPVRTITVDNGTEFHEYARLERATATRFYCATPHHAWERGTNETTNGLVRQYLPKRQSMTHLTQHDCNRIAAKLNRRPRKRLGYRTPEECYAR